MRRSSRIPGTLRWMRLSERRLAQVALLGIVALAVTVVSVAAGTGGDASPPGGGQGSWEGVGGGPRPEGPGGQRMIVVLRTPSLADRVAAAGGLASEADERRWQDAAEGAQQQLNAHPRGARA